MGPGEVKYFPASAAIVGYPAPRRPTIAPMLDDGTYDAIVVDAEPGDGHGSIRLELAIASGPHKGEVIAITAADPAYASTDPLELLAVPATIVVAGGEPVVTLEP